MGERVRIAKAVLDQVLAHAAGEPGVEVCGLLLGRADRIEAALPARNIAADPWRRFEVDPATLLAAHRRARAGDIAVVGHYHSHPGGAPTPSPRDAADALDDGVLWLVLAGGRAQAWRSVAGGPLHGRFVPVALVPAGDGCACDAAPPEGGTAPPPPPPPPR